jgi:hypothetical protein
MPKVTPEELVLDGTKYRIDIDKSDLGFSATWDCPLCRASGYTGLFDGTEQEARQVASDIVRDHHAEAHAASP